jgi:hypothetical protein
MPNASKESASEHEAVEGHEGHFEHFDGGWTVGFEAYSQDGDLAPLFKGLPNAWLRRPREGRLSLGRRRGAAAAPTTR